jgi:hypothetical protein
MMCSKNNYYNFDFNNMQCFVKKKKIGKYYRV